MYLYLLGLCKFWQRLSVIVVHDNSCFKRKSVLDVTYLVEDILHLLACREKLVERTVRNIAETYKVATIAVCSCEVCLVIVYLNRCIRYATNWNNLARKTLFAVLRLVGYA